MTLDGNTLTILFTVVGAVAYLERRLSTIETILKECPYCHRKPAGAQEVAT